MKRLTKSQYEAVAQVLAETKPRFKGHEYGMEHAKDFDSRIDTWQQVVFTLADQLAQSDTEFNQDLFYELCKL